MTSNSVRVERKTADIHRGELLSIRDGLSGAFANVRRQAIEAGARNLLLDCAELSPGDRLLILSEPPDQGHFRAGLAEAVTATARALEIDVSQIEVPFSKDVTEPGREIRDAMVRADCTLFLARLGDQIRFRNTLDGLKAIVSYVLDSDMLASPFGSSEYSGFMSLKKLVDQTVASAREIHVTCPAGTDFSGVQTMAMPPADVRVTRFPMSVFTPSPASGFSGRIAQRGFLVGTGSHYYSPYACAVRDTVFIEFQGNSLVGFSGSPNDVAAVKQHYALVGRAFSIEPSFVHSWHAGIHPGCAFPEPASASFERWTCGAFGNPRLLHFHTCGAYAPGEISLNVLDPTIRFDGIAVWENGRLYPERLSGGAEVLANYPGLRQCFDNPSPFCGVGPSGALSFD